MTLIDIQKTNANILIKYTNGGSYTIDTKGMEISGRGVKAQYDNDCYEVSETKLNSLKKTYNIVCDF